MTTIYTNDEGFLVRQASPDKISGKWKAVVDEIVRSSREHLGSHLVSFYVGGSVAHGTAKEGLSDVDAYAVVDLNREEIKKSSDAWAARERKRIDAAFPFQRGVEVHLIPAGDVSEGKKFQFKVFAAHVYGKDISAELPDYKLDKQTIGRIRVNVKKDIEIARSELAEAEDDKNIKAIGMWISKRLLRSAGMLCLWKENFFTMDRELIAEVVISHYPAQEARIRKLLQMATAGPKSKDEILDMLNTFGTWLIEEDDKVFK